MQKRGQITLFIIIGIIILVVIGLLIFIQPGGIKRLSPVSTVSIKDMIENCVKDQGNDALKDILRQGGDVNPGFYKLYQDNKLSYLCHTDAYSPCINRRPFLDQHIENELNTYIESNFINCFNPTVYENKGYGVTTGDLDIKTTIGQENILVMIDYPIEMKKGNTQVSLKQFSQSFNIPLGKIINTVNDIVKAETTIGDFLVVPYVIKKRGQVEIEKHRVEGTHIYSVNLIDNKHVFNFAVRSWVS